jgi:hypothetical protein
MGLSKTEEIMKHSQFPWTKTHGKHPQIWCFSRSGGSEVVVYLACLSLVKMWVKASPNFFGHGLEFFEISRLGNFLDYLVANYKNES